ncbi:glycosyltransferase 61 family protein [Anderseniella sp. Alg231-50]|uniref:glycosyltransferase 61 family protein n=1 Tax=Anderseniella sp. Alg231-50 TaxID=1922226 RepID=UPI00307CC32C
MGFTLGRPELKLFDDWRFFDPERPFGNNEFDIQERMKMRSTKAAFYIVTDSWVFHHLNMGWKDRPRYLDPHSPDNNIRNPDYLTQGERTSSINYVTRFDDNNIFHSLHLEFFSLANIDPSNLKISNIFIIEDNIDKNDPCQKWRLFVFYRIFCQAIYIRAVEFYRIANSVLVNTSNGYIHHKFIDYPPNAEYIRLTEFIKENTGTTVPEQDYVLLNQRPVGNRYLMEKNSGLPLQEYLYNSLGKLGIPFRSCDFSTMTPKDQAQLCRGARIFISAHGAGCSNIIFTPLHCGVIEYNFRKHWNCDPVCDLHFHGMLADHEECDSELTVRPYFHKADYHNLCRLLDRQYTELGVDRYDGYSNRNPINREYLFVDGAELLVAIEKIFNHRIPKKI